MPPPVLPARNTAIHPAIRPDYSPEQRAAWMRRHEEFCALARRGDAKVIFFGDSLTDHWRDAGQASWNQHFAPLQALNFGISGDRTQQLLWRIEGGELDGAAPRAVVVLIGTNNLTPGLGENSLTPKNTPTHTAAGVAAVLAAVRHRLPSGRILLHALLPRDDGGPALRREVTETNLALARLADGFAIKFFDPSAEFLDANGAISRDIMPDLLHLSPRGYARWAEVLRWPLNTLLY